MILEQYYDYNQTMAIVLFRVSLENKGDTLL